MNVCHLGKGEVEELDKIVKDELRQVCNHGTQASDERLYTDRKEGGRGLSSFKDVYKQTRVRVACYLALSNNEWLRKAWDNEYDKDHLSLKSEAEDILKTCGKAVKFEKGYIQLDEESCMEEIEENRQGRIEEEKVKDIW